MSQFIARKNGHIMELNDKIREQNSEIQELRLEIQQSKQQQDAREVKLLQKFCLVLNAKKQKITELQVMNQDDDDESESDEEMHATQKNVLE